VPTYVIATDRSALSISFKPTLPGPGIRICELRGEFEIAASDDGTVDWDQPASGHFEFRVDVLSVESNAMALGAPQLLGPSRLDRVTGELIDVRRTGHDRFESTVRVALADLELTMAANGRFILDGSDRITVHGKTCMDSNQLGVYLPPFLNSMVHARWKLVLSRAGAESSTKT